jgi:hypothetical protein
VALARGGPGSYHREVTPEDSMQADSSLVSIHTVGRVVLWVVLLILAGAALYAAATALANWKQIGV